VDEKAAAKGYRYLTLVCDLSQATVEYIADERKTGQPRWLLRTPVARAAGRHRGHCHGHVGAEPYVQSCLAHVPEAATKIVFDRFHIMGHMGEALDQVRKSEHRSLRAAGDDTLVGSKYLWLYAQKTLPPQHRSRFATLKASTLKTARAWAIKESLRGLWDYSG
jgi:transposase